MSTVILIIDDSAAIRAAIAGMVRAHRPDWVVLEAADALAALKTVREHNVDVITLDVEMPGVDGLFLAPDLQKYAPDARIAIVTGSSRPNIPAEAERLGCELMRKPLDEDSLLLFFESV